MKIKIKIKERKKKKREGVGGWAERKEHGDFLFAELLEHYNRITSHSIQWINWLCTFHRWRPIIGKCHSDICRSFGCDDIDRIGDVLRGAIQSLLRRKKPIIPWCHIQSVRCNPSASSRRPPVRLASLLSQRVRACSQLCQNPNLQPRQNQSKLLSCDISLPRWQYPR